MASIFKYKKQISLKKEFDDIYAALLKSKVEVGNHSYHCISVNNKFAFIPLFLYFCDEEFYYLLIIKILTYEENYPHFGSFVCSS